MYRPSRVAVSSFCSQASFHRDRMEGVASAAPLNPGAGAPGSWAVGEWLSGATRAVALLSAGRGNRHRKEPQFPRALSLHSSSGQGDSRTFDAKVVGQEER